MEARIAVAKVGKYATSESGDTFEMIERPAGGLSFVLSDGQRSGKAAKSISNAVARKAVSLLADGVRDGAAARAASDYLYTYRAGKVLATLNILSVDLASQTLVITRNNPAPVFLIEERSIRTLDDPVHPIGTRRGVRPEITETALTPNLAVVFFTDGLTHAGERRGDRLDIHAEMEYLAVSKAMDPQVWADHLLARALEAEEGRPSDDISIVVAAILPDEGGEARRMYVRLPL